MPLLNDSTPSPARVLVPEKISPDGLSLLRDNNLEVDERKGLSPEAILKVIEETQPEAILVRSETKVTAELVAAAKKVKVIARAGVGYDNINIEACTSRGILVVNSPTGNVGAAAEHTIALIVSAARNTPAACASLKQGKWERSKFVGTELKGKTLGIIGLGKVGLIVARLAKGLGMNVHGLDPYANPTSVSALNITLRDSLAELLPAVDFLTIHTPLIASTKGMISAAELSQMKKGARIFNVARGGTIDEAALLDFLESGHIAGAGIDVFTSEPPTPDSAAWKLINHPTCVVTPHLGASTVEAQENVSLDVCSQIVQVLRGNLPRSAVNAPIILPEEYRKLQPFVLLVEKMGSLYTQHFTTSHSANRATFDLIYEGEVSEITNTKPLFAALLKGLTAPISSSAGVNVNIVNADIIARERGIIINEQRSRHEKTHSYSSLVTLVARPPSRASPNVTRASNDASFFSSGVRPQPEQIISGYVSGGQIYISRLDRFTTSFVPTGTLLICHNYDSPGKIGVVGTILGKEGVNINYMSVAPMSKGNVDDDGSLQKSADAASDEKEALMILGVNREVPGPVAESLVKEGGVLSVSVVSL